jgi:hypothetical protein
MERRKAHAVTICEQGSSKRPRKGDCRLTDGFSAAPDGDAAMRDAR